MWKGEGEGDIDIEKVLVSNKTSPGEKNYKYLNIGYLHNGNKVRPLNIMFQVLM